MRRVHWDRLFEDLEGQLASDWESERVALDAETERLRISRLDLHTRLRILCSASASASIELAGGLRLPVRLRALGADWVAAAVALVDRGSRAQTTRLIPLEALRGVSVDHGLLLSTLEAVDGTTTLRERMTLGFMLRDLARRRIPVRVLTVDGTDLHGTVDRAGADHLDLALHDPDEPRRASAVRGFRIIPLGAIASVEILGDQLP